MNLTLSNHFLGYCAFALFCMQADVPSKPLSPFPPTFSLAGSWSCSGSFRSGKLHRADFSGAASVGGKWLLLTEVDIEPATGYKATYLIGYDAAENRLVEFDANNFGAAIYRSSVGWQEDTLTMESQETHSPAHPYAADRFVYSITAEGFMVDWQVKRQYKSDWSTLDRLLCKTRQTA